MSNYGYNLELANGQKWHLLSTEAMQPWLDKFARITELKPSQTNGYPKLIFSDPNEMLAKTGWKAYDFKSGIYWSHPQVPDTICEIISDQTTKISPMRRLSNMVYPIYRRIQECGSLPFHSALIQRNGQAVLLAAASGTGKSTCCRRIPLPWEPVCEDEVLILQNPNKRYVVHPFPTWSLYLSGNCHKTYNVQQYFPLKAIFFLIQAEKDKVSHLTKREAAMYIDESATQLCRRNWRTFDKETRISEHKKVFDNACQLAKAINCYILHISLTGRFWEEIEKIL
jgi:SynChlorMet cassette protein ScmC